MTRRPFLAALSAFGLAPGLAVAQAGAAKIEPLLLSDAQWKQRLAPAAYEVLRHENEGLLNLIIESLENSIETTAKFLDEINGLRVKRAS